MVRVVKLKHLLVFSVSNVEVDIKMYSDRLSNISTKTLMGTDIVMVDVTFFWLSSLIISILFE